MNGFELRLDHRMEQSQRLEKRLDRLFKAEEDERDQYVPLREILQKLIEESKSKDGKELFKTRQEDLKIESLEDFDQFIHGLISDFERALSAASGRTHADRQYSLPKHYKTALERACYLAFVVHFGVKRKEKNRKGFPLDYVVHTLRAAFKSRPELGMGTNILINVLRAIMDVLHDTFEDWEKGQMIVELESGTVLEAIRLCINEKIQREVYRRTAPKKQHHSIVEGIEKVTNPKKADRLESFLHIFTGLEDIWDLIAFEVKLDDRFDNSQTFGEHTDSFKRNLMLEESRILARAASEAFHMRKAADRQLAVLARVERKLKRGQPESMRADASVDTAECSEPDYILKEREYRSYIVDLRIDFEQYMRRGPNSFERDEYEIVFIPRSKGYGSEKFFGVPHLGHVYIYPTNKAKGGKKGLQRMAKKIMDFFNYYAPRPHSPPIYFDSENPLDRNTYHHGRILSARRSEMPYIGVIFSRDLTESLEARIGYTEAVYADENKTGEEVAARKSRYETIIREAVSGPREAAHSILPSAKIFGQLKREGKVWEERGCGDVFRNMLQASFLQYFEQIAFAHQLASSINTIRIEGHESPIRIPNGVCVMQMITAWNFGLLDNFKAYVKRGEDFEEVADDYIIQNGDELRIIAEKGSIFEGKFSPKRFQRAARRIESFKTMVVHGQEREKTINGIGLELYEKFLGIGGME